MTEAELNVNEAVCFEHERRACSKCAAKVPCPYPRCGVAAGRPCSLPIGKGARRLLEQTPHVPRLLAAAAKGLM